MQDKLAKETEKGPVVGRSVAALRGIRLEEGFEPKRGRGKGKRKKGEENGKEGLRSRAGRCRLDLRTSSNYVLVSKSGESAHVEVRATVGETGWGRGPFTVTEITMDYVEKPIVKKKKTKRMRRKREGRGKTEGKVVLRTTDHKAASAIRQKEE